MNLLTEIQKTMSSVNFMQSLFLLGVASAEYLDAERNTTKAKDEYIHARDKFIKNSCEELPWEKWIEDSEFQDATSGLYKSYRDAKRIQYNAKRRMDTKFRQYRLTLCRSSNK